MAAAPRFFRLNQYNWFGQKLLVQHRYNDLLHLRHNLSSQNDGVDLAAETLNDSHRPLSDHLIYITGLALMKTSTRLDELIYTLQRLNFQKNGQYFLLLCQCLLYLGNHDAVVALCKQILNKEISTLPAAGQEGLANDEQFVSSVDELSLAGDGGNGEVSLSPRGATSDERHTEDHQRKQTWCLQQIYEESIEFRRIFDSVNKNCLINDPRLWFIFALSLEFQLQFEDADLAYRVACKLAAGQAKQISANWQEQQQQRKSTSSKDQGFGTIVVVEDGSIGGSADNSSEYSSIGISNYYTPHKNYGEFCIRNRGDYRTAMQILGQATQISPPINYTLNPALALTLCSQANSNTNHFTKALEMINSLDNHSASLRNPSFIYNQLALKCKQKLNYHGMTKQSVQNDYLDRVCDERRFDLDYALIKSHIVINHLVQSSSNLQNLYKCPASKALPATSTNMNKPDQIYAQIDKTLEALRGSNSNSWSSHALWNNLGICYLLKRRYIASLSCLTKAQQLNPIDWRINYNLSLVYLHVGLPVRALCCSLASKNYRIIQQESATKYAPQNGIDKPCDPITCTMIAISYSELTLTNEARRFYAEMIALGRNGGVIRTPILALINYLLLLHQDTPEAVEIDNSDERNVKSIIRLLDLIEQAWLQRNPNDSQFAQTILELANQIGEAQQRRKNQLKKAYAWTKFE